METRTRLPVSQRRKPKMPTKPKFSRQLQRYFLSTQRRHTAAPSTRHSFLLTDYQEMETETEQIVKEDRHPQQVRLSCHNPDQYGDMERSYSTH